ncbi:hypothetical protein CLAFUW4_04221 [Fulvia fulva]|uniref:Uncharacterized protein n=1 Tax=Passalora fulva TaxID=5499 RepID=A0A9Q8LE50_PASFU|nr:uncharacterized protein CLAFUR5_04187 [Fulvia fulva]KAK4626976.1 hypothetical protein CLAFUR4_04207 [Fulvia fulva]KAK4628364.1 hypothetical protein CLAFUR0_04209 [Fulvia fulva]UJO15730.1 hypothetical protein CLAFUR5_04187 [Fulvia fulva]WPV14348.1 hypothetical protein CLAFUW4_04221 [Fulvia fulva]WPV28363.1 hypothetical protein CLAFUW7_04210 [Fulvia fulva]
MTQAAAPEGEDYTPQFKSEQEAVKYYSTRSSEQYGIPVQVIDRSQKNRVPLAEWSVFDSFANWSVFNNLLAEPDAEYEIAFRLLADPSFGLSRRQHLQRCLRTQQDLPT